MNQSKLNILINFFCSFFGSEKIYRLENNYLNVIQIKML